MNTLRMGPFAWGLFCTMTFLTNLHAADWPSYKADASRSSVTRDELKYPLVPAWVFEPSHSPAPAWPEPSKEPNRQSYDRAPQPVIARGIVYFASSSEDTVWAVDAGSGRVRWMFSTSGPVRFAPAIALGRAYVASDDGYLYCLDARSGKLLWKFHGAPSGEMLMGNGRMISRWPLRSGVLVDGGVVYFTAGMWPTEGIFVYAINAKTGKQLWKNDSSGSMYINLPHGGASAITGVSPQGYLSASNDTLLVPTGRSVPAAFDRHSGKFLYYRPAENKFEGGVWTTVAGDIFFNPKNGRRPEGYAGLGESQPGAGDGIMAYTVRSGNRSLFLQNRHRVLANGNALYSAGGGKVERVDLKKWRRQRNLNDCIQWSAEQGLVRSMALAGQSLLLGGDNTITALDAEGGKQLWAGRVEGQVRGLAVSDGRLVASTGKGTVVCFQFTGRPAKTRTVHGVSEKAISIKKKLLALAKEIVRKSKINKGYGVVLGESDSRLAVAIASLTDLQVISVLADENTAARERGRLMRAGLNGARVLVHSFERVDKLPYTPYFADLVVVAGDTSQLSGKEVYRLLRPCGGVLSFGGVDPSEVNRLIWEGAIPTDEVQSAGASTTVVRGKLPGAGEWRHQWADSGRSGIGSEKRVRLPLQTLWYGGPGPARMMDRHWHGSSPLSTNGRAFVTGQNHVIAFDAYNGREHWSREIANVGRRGTSSIGANLVADDDCVYAAVGAECIRLDQKTGQTLARYSVPESLLEKDMDGQTPLVDVEWPNRWQVFGPVPEKSPAVDAATLKTIPQSLTVDGKKIEPITMTTVKHGLDFTNLWGGYGFQPLKSGEQPGPNPGRKGESDMANQGRIVYAFANVICPVDGQLFIGSGSDWWMQWYLDGQPIYNTMSRGNRSEAIGMTNHVFKVDVKAGEHVLAVMVKSGSRGWNLFSAGGAKYEQVFKARLAQQQATWGYLTVSSDLVIGTFIGAETPANEGKAVFALNKNDGSLRWVYQPQQQVPSTGLVFDGGTVYLMDVASPADMDRARRRGIDPNQKRSLVALNMSDGSVKWRQPGLPWARNHLQISQGILLVNGANAYDAASGKMLWQKPISSARPPVIYKNWIIAQPNAYDLRTGVKRQTSDILTGVKRSWSYTRAYGCNAVSGCENLLFFRSGTAGFFDIHNDGTANFGGMRTNCALNTVAANGVLITPESSSGCACSYNFQTSMAFISAPPQRDQWYIFQGGKSGALVRHFRLNFGAPGDRRDGKGNAWLGFPRPAAPGACPAPASVLGDYSDKYHVATAPVKSDDKSIPWVYTTGVRARGKLIFDLMQVRPVELLPLKAAPVIDGKLDDEAWRGARPARFLNYQHLQDPKTSVLLGRDAEHFYLAYRRQALFNGSKPFPFISTQTGQDAACASDDEFELFLTDEKYQRALHVGVSCGGGSFDGINDIARKTPTSLTWNGEWNFSVHKTDLEWTAEVAIPFNTLKKVGLDPKRLRINLMSQNLSGRGPARIYFTNPYSRSFNLCRGTSSVCQEPHVIPERLFTIKLHFAEVEGIPAGQRKFDVVLQGETVLKDFDIAKEAGENYAIVKTFNGIRSDDVIELELIPSGPANSPEDMPIISGIEVTEEKSEGE